MKKKRPETTIYLGNEVMDKLRAYCHRYPHPPSMSTVVREAVEQYVTDMTVEQEALPPDKWVQMTENYVAKLRAEQVNVSTQSILDALRKIECDRIGDIVKGDRS